MSNKADRNEQGITHVLLAIVFVAVVAIIALIGLYVANSSKTPSTAAGSNTAANTTNTAAASVAQTACLSKYHDSDLCAFVAAEAATPFEKTSAKISITGTSGGSADTITLQQDGKGNDASSLTGGGQTINTVVFDNQTYIQETAGGSWVTYGSAGSSNTSTSSAPDSSLNSFLGSVSTTTFTKLGNESCGSLTCIKYQIHDSTAPGSTQYAWIDTGDHLLRQYYDSDPSSGDQLTMVISYQPVSISKPSPVQNLSASGQ